MRQPKPFFKKSHCQWYVQIGKKQIPLGRDQKAAFDSYHAIMAGREELTPDTRVVDLIDQFLDWSHRNHKASTYGWYRDLLYSFRETIGDRLRVGDLKPFHLTRWLDQEYAGTGNNWRHGAIRTVQRALNWAVKEGHLPASPLAHVKKPTPTPREVYLLPDQWKRLVAAVKDQPFLDFITIMRETGCRPLEARTVEARHFDREGRCWFFPKEESKGGREPRVVLLNDRAFEITQRLALKTPEGPLFRNMHGQPWKKYALNCRCRRLKKKLGFHICPYAIRHTFATDAIVRGVDLQTIATLLGHRNLTMLTKIYQHIKLRGDHLREGLRKATEGNAA